MFDDFENDRDEDDRPPAAVAASQGLQPPRFMTDCLGHESVEKVLLDHIQNDRLPHALIFAGPQGIGKATMAFRLARYLLKNGRGGEGADSGGLFAIDELPKEKPQSLHIGPEDRIFHQVASGGHADLMTIERLFDDKKNRYKGSVEIDEIRRITPFMRMTASQGGWRIAIVDDADTMNRNAQNAILKILEEPPAHALLILVCHRLGAMVPTIRSRCRTMSFSPLERSSFGALLGRDHGNLPEGDIDTLYNISGGSVGQALRIVEEGGLETISKITVLLHGWPDWQWSQIHMLAESMSRPGQDDSLKSFQDVFLWVVNTLLRCKARHEMPPGSLNNEATRKLLDHYSLEDWVEIAGRVREHFDTVSAANLDKRHAVLGAFSLFKKAA